MTPHLEWHKNRRADVDSVTELDEMIDNLTNEATADNLPFSVELHMNGETCLMITVGREESHMEFYSAHGIRRVSGPIGPWDSNELIVFNYRGQYSELPKRFFVPIAIAREALRHYFQTKRRPENINWK